MAVNWLINTFWPCLSYKNICTHYGAEGIVEQGGGREERGEGEGKEGRRKGGREEVGLVSCIFLFSQL